MQDAVSWYSATMAPLAAVAASLGGVSSSRGESAEGGSDEGDISPDSEQSSRRMQEIAARYQRRGYNVHFFDDRKGHLNQDAVARLGSALAGKKTG